MTTSCYIAVGSNLGDRSSQIETAKSLLCEEARISFQAAAPIYETQPIGGPEQGKFLNTVWRIETLLDPRELLKRLLAIEAHMGRVRNLCNEPRVIDLDLLFYGDEVIHAEGLTVPHPRLHERWFVLKPLEDLAPEAVHPVLKKNVRELLAQWNHHQWMAQPGVRT
jgi:2-amino-4-hydroxy-6-hydroxymethyldihydropteridine diphosphokinase